MIDYGKRASQLDTPFLKPMYFILIANFLVIQTIYSANHGVRWYHVGAGVGDDI